MDLEKLYRLEAEFELMANARRARTETYRSRIEMSKALRAEAVADAHPDYQAKPLAELLTLTSDKLEEAGVDEKKLRRAAIERHLADGVQRGDPMDEKHFAALSTLLPKLRDHAGA